MITDDERFIKIQGILALSDIHPNDCIKINDLIIDLSKQKQQLQSVIDKAIEKIQLLIDIGFDYDSYRQADSLMTLIDELVSYAKESRDILRSKE